MSNTSSPLPDDPRTATARLLVVESAQARKPIADFLANKVEETLLKRMTVGVIVKGTPAYIRARDLARRLRQAGAWEYNDRELADLPAKVLGFLSFGGFADVT